MKSFFTFLFALFILVNLNAQNENCNTNFFNEKIKGEQNSNDRRDKLHLKYLKENHKKKQSLFDVIHLSDDTRGLLSQRNNNNFDEKLETSEKQLAFATVSKTVNCTAGNLSTLLSTEELNTVTDLTITGTIDARDFKTMRDNMPLLAILDISTAVILSYKGTGGTAGTDNVVYIADAIPEYAFWDYDLEVGKTSLTSIKFPSSLKIIGKCAFNECEKLTDDLNIPQSVTKIDYSAFGGCKGLTNSLIIPALVDTIGDYAFEYCTNLKGSLSLPSGILYIGDGAFKGCKGFNGFLILGDSLKYIGNAAFGGCENFTGSLTIPANVENIGDNAFASCYGLNGELSIGNSLKKLGSGAFWFCNRLKGEIVIPSSIEIIDANTFRRCDSLSSIKIPASVTYIDDMAFAGCGAKLIIDNSNQNYLIENDILYNSDKTRLISCYSSKSGTINILSSVKIIGSSAFWFSQSNSISIPSNVTQIVENPFQVNLGIFQVDVNNPNYASIDGVLFNKNKNILISCPSSKKGVFTIPLSVDTIGFTSFVYSALSSITIPTSINIIESGAFQLSYELKSIYSLRNYPISLDEYEGVFYGINKQSCYLYVPKGFKNVYQVNLQWKDFVNINELTGLDLSSSFENLQSANNYIQVNIISNNSWTTSSNQPWLTVSPTSGTGNATITLTAEENNTTAERTAIVTVTSTGLPNKTITVKQVGKTTGIEDLSNSPIKIYPNPTKDRFAIAGLEGVATVEIFNISGNLKMKIITTANKPISVENLTKGLYILKLKTSTSTINKKLIID